MTSTEQKATLFEQLRAIQERILRSDDPRSMSLLALGYMLATAREAGITAQEIVALRAMAELIEAATR